MTQLADLERHGFAVTPPCLDAARLGSLAAEFDSLQQAHAAGDRDGLSRTSIRELAACPAIRALVEPVLGPSCFAVRATLFDKSPAANWLVAWHQDITVPLQRRAEIPGFGPWSEKQGMPFAQAPDALLAAMLAVRVHVDAATATNGALRVIPGSHLHGKLTPVAIAARTATVTPFTCLVPAGAALLMRPLLLHASSRSQFGEHRRVVHLEFAASELPPPLRWHDRC